MRELPPTAVIVPKWIRVGLGEIGTIEDTRSGQSNPGVEKYHAITRAGKADDGVAWCASYAGWCLEMAGVTSTKNKAASSYISYGDACLMRFGSILVFGKADPDAKGTGHVGFGMGISGKYVYVLGGNQRNEVNISPRLVSTVVAIRWPKSIELPSLEG